MGAVFSAFVARAAGTAHTAVATAEPSTLAVGLRDAFLFGAAMMLVALLLGAWTLKRPSRLQPLGESDPLPVVID